MELNKTRKRLSYQLSESIRTDWKFPWKHTFFKNSPYCINIANFSKLLPMHSITRTI